MKNLDFRKRLSNCVLAWGCEIIINDFMIQTQFCLFVEIIVYVKTLVYANDILLQLAVVEIKRV